MSSSPTATSGPSSGWSGQRGIDGTGPQTHSARGATGTWHVVSAMAWPLFSLTGDGGRRRMGDNIGAKAKGNSGGAKAMSEGDRRRRLVRNGDFSSFGRPRVRGRRPGANGGFGRLHGVGPAREQGAEL